MREVARAPLLVADEQQRDLGEVLRALGERAQDAEREDVAALHVDRARADEVVALGRERAVILVRVDGVDVAEQHDPPAAAAGERHDQVVGVAGATSTATRSKRTPSGTSSSASCERRVGARDVARGRGDRDEPLELARRTRGDLLGGGGDPGIHGGGSTGWSPNHASACIMGRMRRAARTLAAVLLAAAALGACGGGDGAPSGSVTDSVLAAQRTAGFPLHWVGDVFEGLALMSATQRPAFTSLIYGSCKPAGNDTGCAPPLQIQTSSICVNNALVLDIRPLATFKARGMTVSEYGYGQLALDSGAMRVTIGAEEALGRRALAALRPVSGPRRLPAPRYPLYYLDQLRRVQAAYDRSRSVKAVRDKLGISRKAVRYELGLARELGRERLARGRGAKPALAEVKRERFARAEREAAPVDCELEPAPG